eukprot:jgi/Chlat1/6969/Chrsp52S09109
MTSSLAAEGGGRSSTTALATRRTELAAAPLSLSSARVSSAPASISNRALCFIPRLRYVAAAGPAKAERFLVVGSRRRRASGYYRQCATRCSASTGDVAGSSGFQWRMPRMTGRRRHPNNFSSDPAGAAPSADPASVQRDPDAPDFAEVQPVAKTKDEKKKVMILMSDTGGGHRASAEALKMAFEQEFPDQFEVSVVDIWTHHTPYPFNQLPKSYSFLVKHGWLWKAAFYFSYPQTVHKPHFTAVSAFVAKMFFEAFQKYKPDIIVSVHPLMQHVPIRVMKRRGLYGRIPFATVVTDLTTVHPTWFHTAVSVCCVPNEEVERRALNAGLKPHQIRLFGLPIRPVFAKPTSDKETMRRQLGLQPNLPMVLLASGGEGIGPVEATAKALAEKLSEGSAPIGQLVVICGRNKQLAATLKKHKWAIPVQVNGFVNNMSEWMAAADCLVTKAGPGTIAEALIRGLPLILNDAIAGQEAGNIPYVENHGVGRFCKDPKGIAEIVGGWFGSAKEQLQRMSEAARSMGRPHAVIDIVRELAHLVWQHQHQEHTTPDFAALV